MLTGAGKDCKAGSGDEVDHIRDGCGDRKVGGAGQRGCETGQEHVQYGLLHVSVHSGGRTSQDHTRPLYTGGVLRGGGHQAVPHRLWLRTTRTLGILTCMHTALKSVHTLPILNMVNLFCIGQSRKFQ